MGLGDDNQVLAAVTLTRHGAKESEGPRALEGGMLEYLGGRAYATAPRTCNWWPSRAGVHFKSLDVPARVTEADSMALLVAAEVDALEGPR